MTWGGHKLWKGTVQDKSLEEGKYRKEVTKIPCHNITLWLPCGPSHLPRTKRDINLQMLIFKKGGRKKTN
jgi:hypothetical protein